MDVASFWELIERSRQETSDPDGRLRWLMTRLAEKPLADIVDFQVCLDRVRCRADTWRMWGAAYLICDRLSGDDSFWYFQAWLIGLGRDTFEQAVADPDSLAEVPEVLRLAGRPVQEWSDDQWPEWESLSYVAAEAYERRVREEADLDDALQARGHHPRLGPHPTGPRWDFQNPVETARRLPRLSRIFSLTSQATRDGRGRP